MGWDFKHVPGHSSIKFEDRIISQTPDRFASVRAGFEAACAEAARFLGATSPNPAVGCCLLDEDGTILVTEAHHRAGMDHAEARALYRAREAGVLDRAVTALVTLEPCNHVGRTPPCSEALRNSPVRQVWVGARDPNPVAGGGIAHLRQMPEGRDVILLDSVQELREIHLACLALTAPFAQRITEGRPWITVKQALDVRGSMIPPGGQTTFTSARSLGLAHRLRRATDAVITGIGTVLSDSPRFSVRHVADHDNRAPRLLVVCDREGRLSRAWRESMEVNGFTVIVSRDLAKIPCLLADHGVNWAMIEAGPGLLAEVERLDLWNDWLTIQARESGPDEVSICARSVSPLRFLMDEGQDVSFADKATF